MNALNSDTIFISPEHYGYAVCIQYGYNTHECYVLAAFPTEQQAIDYTGKLDLV